MHALFALDHPRMRALAHRHAAFTWTPVRSRARRSTVGFAWPCAERCRADGVPASNFNPVQAPVILLGSNEELQPERARDRNLGLDYSAPWLHGLDLSLPNTTRPRAP